MPPKPRNLDHLPELARRLVYFRGRFSLKQAELAKKLGMSQQNVSSWESGNTVPTIDGYAGLISLAQENGLEEDRLFFLGKVRDLLSKMGIPVDELRQTYTKEERERLKRRA